METKTETLCLQYITNAWRELRSYLRHDESLSWAVWIRLYNPISVGMNSVDDYVNTLMKVWFLTERGLEERDPWEYARFIVVNSYRPWSSMSTPPHVTIWGKTHEIGLAAFAECIEQDLIYLEYQWGNLWGKGYRMKVDVEGQLQIEKRVWIS